MKNLKTGIFYWLIMLFATIQVAQAADEILPPWEAFTLEAHVDGDKIIATWKIVDGYYLYKDKIKFSSSSEQVILGEAVFPAGTMHHGILPDGNEGDVEVYKKDVSIEIPIVSNAVNDFTLKAISQGCSDTHGVCLIRYNYKQELSLNSLKTASTSDSDPINGISDLSSQLGIDSGDSNVTILQPEIAFQREVKIVGNHLEVSWVIADDYYMYKNKFVVTSNTDGVIIGNAVIPKGKMKEGVLPDGNLGEVETYKHNVTIKYPILTDKTDLSQIDISVRGQGCAETLGVCLQELKLPYTLDVKGVDFAATDLSTAEAPSTEADMPITEIILALSIAFVAGLALTFTPCVLPMLPIIGSIIAGQGEKVTRLRGGLLATAYVLGTSVTWTAAGIFAGNTGDQLTAYTTHPAFVIPIATVIFILALAMLGLFHIQMPSSFQSKAQEHSHKLKGGTYVGVFFMGILASMVAGACVAPILISSLTIAIDTQSGTLGGGIMFSMAMGMGVPIILIGIGAGALLPKAGAWMDTVKHIFGVILVGLAIYFLAPIAWIPILYLWAVFLIITGVYMGATQSLTEGSGKGARFARALGTVVLIWGILALIGAMQGQRDVMHPISMGTSSMSSNNASMVEAGTSPTAAKGHTVFISVSNLVDLQSELAAAKAAGKPAFLDYYGDWCGDCVKMKNTTFTEAAVISRLNNNYVVIKADISDQFGEGTRAMKKHFKVYGAPAMLIFDSNGKLVSKEYGYMDKEELFEMLDKANVEVK